MSKKSKNQELVPQNTGLIDEAALFARVSEIIENRKYRTQAQANQEGVLRGYLAFVDGLAIGWCNANDRANYPAEPVYDDTPFHAPAEKREKTVICFEISPKYRGKGIATALLHQVITDAKAEGYNAVAGFPVVRDERYEWDNPGPIRLYEKDGFSKVSEKDRRVAMQKELR